ncbi:GTP-binding protein [Pseudoalteromonas sp. Hal099]
MLACFIKQFLKNWPTDPELLADINSKWVEPFGDMRQELVFIGQSLNKQAMIEALDDCLLPEEAVLKGKVFGKPITTRFLFGRKCNECPSSNNGTNKTH